ncbi:MAG: hypothetical protein JSW34_04825 [Candidatus Zixiibacteriota bacterium]|nr:MAG: hypothetical protein JSW34_04825 [candidate division Zixibacteria bacterium]
MFCAHCSEKIMGTAVKLAGEHFCSEECANIAAGLDPEEENGFIEEEDSVDDFFEEYDE